LRLTTDKQRLDFLRRLTDASGVSGFEDEARKVIKEEVKDLAEISVDGLGSVIAKKRGASDEPRVMIAGHMDEIGFIVTKVLKEGFLKFQPLGGWWDNVLLAQRVVVKTGKGDLYGVIGSKPPHILPEDERSKVVKKKDMFIDIGADDEDEVAALGVRPGDPVIPDSRFQVMGNGKLVMAKAWDDRVGVAVFIEVMRALKDRPHPNTLYGVATVQEEVGLRGAKTSSDIVNPQVGFAIDVDIAGDTPGVGDDALAKIGKGPTILILDGSTIPNRRLLDLCVDTARSEDIPFQFSALPGGGTDAGRIHLHSGGVPSVVIGVPTRYIHSHTGIIDQADFEKAVELLVAVIGRLDAATVASLVR